MGQIGILEGLKVSNNSQLSWWKHRKRIS